MKNGRRVLQIAATPFIVIEYPAEAQQLNTVT